MLAHFYLRQREYTKRVYIYIDNVTFTPEITLCFVCFTPSGPQARIFACNDYVFRTSTNFIFARHWDTPFFVRHYNPTPTPYISNDSDTQFFAVGTFENYRSEVSKTFVDFFEKYSDRSCFGGCLPQGWFDGSFSPFDFLLQVLLLVERVLNARSFSSKWKKVEESVLDMTTWTRYVLTTAHSAKCEDQTAHISSSREIMRRTVYGDNGMSYKFTNSSNIF